MASGDYITVKGIRFLQSQHMSSALLLTDCMTVYVANRPTSSENGMEYILSTATQSEIQIVVLDYDTIFP